MGAPAKFFQEFASLYDPVHGQIDLSDSAANHEFGDIRRILSSPMLDRLRRIKQLGFASYTYLSADHSRYAHSLGTMQVMRAILRRLDQLEAESGNNRFPLKEVRDRFQSPEVAAMDDDTLVAYLKQHTLAAALLQDVGELPYETATSRVFSPDFDTLNRVKQLVGFEVDTWESKHVFTLASLIEEENQSYLDGFNAQLLAFLIAGQNYPWISSASGLEAWLQMLNGEVDADRLDYVYRDAHHTVGGRGTPLAVVNSISSFDERGPIFSEAGPVTDFISTRGHLWTNVYLEAQNRFRRMLLLILLREVLSSDKHSKRFLESGVAPELGMPGFKQLDDVWLWGRLREVYESARLGYHAQRALEILMNERNDYGFVWIGPQSPGAPVEDIELPSGLFFDTYSELYRHWLYEPGSIRIDTKSFRYLGSPLPLEECSSLGKAFTRDVAPQPVPNAIQVFIPAKRQGAAWKKIDDLLNSGSLHGALKSNDPLHALEIPSDTRNTKGFKPPALFVSFRWSDVDYVDEVIRALYREKRQYFALRGKHTGVGAPTEENSRNAVREAEAVLIVASVQYAEQYKNLPNGNIHHEISEMTKRRDPARGKDLLPLALISVDPWTEIEASLPWSDLGYPTVPFLGSPLKSMSQKEITELVREAVRSIDAQLSK